MDVDRDGWLSRAELAEVGLEAWLAPASAERLSPKHWRMALRRDLVRESHELFHLFDTDRDGGWSAAEVPRAYRSALARLDVDGDDRITVGEVARLPDLPAFDPLVFADPGSDPVARWVWLESLVERGPARLDDLGPVALEELRDYDFDGDGRVSWREIERGEALLEAPVTFHVEEDVARAFGLLTDELVPEVERLLADHPGLRWLELAFVPGTIDEDSVFDAAELLRERGISTRVPAGGMIASGGVILLGAGVRREVVAGARVGVHSWSYRIAGITFDGRDLPRTAPDHAWALERLRALDLPEALYWFELRTPSDRLHWMSRNELERYGFDVIAPLGG